MIDEAAAEEARDREVRRPRGEVQRLEEEKRDLERRLATVERELEKARAKMPGATRRRDEAGIRTI